MGLVVLLLLSDIFFSFLPSFFPMVAASFLTLGDSGHVPAANQTRKTQNQTFFLSLSWIESPLSLSLPEFDASQQPVEEKREREVFFLKKREEEVPNPFSGPPPVSTTVQVR